MPRDSIEHSTLNLASVLMHEASMLPLIMKGVCFVLTFQGRELITGISYAGLCPSRDGNCTHKEVDSIGYDSLSILSEVQTQSRYVSVEINILLLDFRLALLTS